MTLCRVTCHHACNMVLVEAIMCSASLSHCYTATCCDIDECIRSCRRMGDSKYKDSTLHIQAEQTQIQWKLPLLVCCFHEDSNIMACRVCINRFWLAGGKAIILISFPFYTCIVVANLSRGCQLTYRQRLYSFHQISISCINITKYTVQVLERNPEEKCSELIHSICPTNSEVEHV